MHSPCEEVRRIHFWYVFEIRKYIKQPSRPVLGTKIAGVCCSKERGDTRGPHVVVAWWKPVPVRVLHNLQPLI